MYPWFNLDEYLAKDKDTSIGSLIIKNINNGFLNSVDETMKKQFHPDILKLLENCL